MLCNLHVLSAGPEGWGGYNVIGKYEPNMKCEARWHLTL